MARKIKKADIGFPPIVFVKRESDGDETYLEVGENETDLLDEEGEAVRIGVYELVSVKEVKRKTIAEVIPFKEAA